MTRYWWVLLATGIAWIIYGFIVLNASGASIAAIAGLFGIGFIVGGSIEVLLAFTVDGFRWLRILLGVVSFAAGMTALVWPGRTVLVLAAIIGWYLMFDGIFNAVGALATRSVNDLWLLSLLFSIGEIALGVWATGYAGRSLALLFIWVASGAIVRGITNIFAAMGLHGADHKLREILE